MNDKMIDPTSLAFDIDGVVADTMSLFISIARNEYDIRVRYQDITRYMLEECPDLKMDAGIVREIIGKLLDGTRDTGLKPMAGAPEVLSRLGNGYGPIRFVTARPAPESIALWMQQILQTDAGQLDIVATGSFEAKADVLREKGISWFVEDRLETCFLLREAGITPILFRHPWNREPHPFTEVGNWDELEALIAF